MIGRRGGVPSAALNHYHDGLQPAVHAFRFFVDAGGLMSYGATLSEVYSTAAEQVAKILDSARPSDLPLRQATRFELVINTKTAKALGITIPPSLLERADAVIDEAVLCLSVADRTGSGRARRGKHC